MALPDISYQDLPEFVKNNLSEDQFELAKVDILEPGETIPETTEYVDLATGVRKIYRTGDAAPSSLLPAHDLTGARGKDSSQWEREHRF